MGSHGIRILWAFLLLCLTSEAAYGIRFRNPSFTYPVSQGSSLDIQLLSLVTGVQPGESIKWVPRDMPGWLTLDAATGRLSGSPATGQTGTFSFTIKVSQGESGDSATFEVLSYRTPRWRHGQVDLGVQWEEKLFRYDLSQAVENPDEIPLKFTASGLPRWLALTLGGAVSGTPGSEDLGPYTGILFTLEDAYGNKDSVIGFGQVKAAASLPQWKSDPVQGPKGIEDALYRISLGDYVTNTSNLALRYEFVGTPPSWINLTANGSLFGVPRRAQVGTQKVRVRLVTSLAGQAHSAETVIEIPVQRVNKAPKWVAETLQLPKGATEVPYTQSLLDYVSDPDVPFGDVMAFTVLQGPPWATVTPQGELTGIPAPGDAGMHEWRIEAKDSLGLTAQATLRVEVEKTNHPPQVKPDIRFSLRERETLRDHMVEGGYVVDSDGDEVSFAPDASTPEWITLSEDGTLELKPVFAHIGDHTVKFTVTDGKLASAGEFRIKVIRNPRPPVWLNDPIRFDATVGIIFKENLNSHVEDLDGLPITFYLEEGPNWISVDGEGNLVGTPAAGHEGTNRLRVGARNDLLGGIANVVIEVKPGNRPPQWREDPVALPDAPPGSPFSLDLSQYVQDPDGDSLTFRKVMGPDWMGVSADGKVSGTPTTKDNGQYAAVFEASDGKTPVQAGALGKVVAGNSSPRVRQEALRFLVEVGDSLSRNLADPKYVEDPEGDPLGFELLASSDWVTLNQAGRLDVRPQASHVGEHEFPFRVSDGKNAVSAKIHIKVTQGAEGPVWLEDPIQFTARVSELLEADLSKKVVDPASSPLTFRLKSGPGWLGLSPKGKLSGIPGQSDVGMNRFEVVADNGASATVAELRVQVRPGDLVQKIALDTPVPGARTEILWVVDNSTATASYLDSLQEGVRALLTNLNGSQIRYSFTLLSSREWGGEPVVGTGGSYLMKWSDGDPAGEFQRRVDSIASSETRNSPTWAMTTFYERAPTLLGVYKNGFFMSEVPMEVFLFTGQGDGYEALSQGTGFAGYGPGDYLAHFHGFHWDEGQPLTISAMDLRCPSPFDPSKPGQPRPSYLTMTLGTLGSYFHHDAQCTNRIVSALASYAYSVRFRAYVFAKNKIKLDDTPADSRGIRVSLYHFQKIALTGNTGGPRDQWSYDPVSNEVRIHWERISTPVNIGDELIIEY